MASGYTRMSADRGVGPRPEERPHPEVEAAAVLRALDGRRALLRAAIFALAVELGYQGIGQRGPVKRLPPEVRRGVMHAQRAYDASLRRLSDDELRTACAAWAGEQRP